MRTVNKVIIVAVLICMNMLSVGAAGLLTFDIENWAYSILSYTEQGTQTINFIKNVQREIEQAQKLYESLSQGQILEAMNTLNGTINRLEKNIGKYVEMNGIASDISGIRNNLMNAVTSGDLSNPTYLSSIWSDMAQISSRMADAKAENTRDKQEAMAERAERADEQAEMSEEIASSESQTQQLSYANQISVENQIAEEDKKVEEFVDEQYGMTEEEYNRLYSAVITNSLVASRKSANKEYEEQINDIWSSGGYDKGDLRSFTD